MELWICGQYRSGEEVGKVIWVFQGVFSTKGKAIAACRNETYFIVPVELDDEIQDEMCEWLGVEYPLA